MALTFCAGDSVTCHPSLTVSYAISNCIIAGIRLLYTRARDYFSLLCTVENAQFLVSLIACVIFHSYGGIDFPCSYRCISLLPFVIIAGPLSVFQKTIPYSENMNCQLLKLLSFEKLQAEAIRYRLLSSATRSGSSITS